MATIATWLVGTGAWSTAANWDINGVNVIPTRATAYDFTTTTAIGNGITARAAISAGNFSQNFESFTFKAIPQVNIYPAAKWELSSSYAQSAGAWRVPDNTTGYIIDETDASIKAKVTNALSHQWTTQFSNANFAGGTNSKLVKKGRGDTGFSGGPTNTRNAANMPLVIQDGLMGWSDSSRIGIFTRIYLGDPTTPPTGRLGICGYSNSPGASSAIAQTHGGTSVAPLVFEVNRSFTLGAEWWNTTTATRIIIGNGSYDTIQLNNTQTEYVISLKNLSGELRGTITGNANLTIEGFDPLSTLTFSAANTFTGVVRANNATLTLSNTNALQNAILVIPSSTPTIAASSIIGGLSGSNNFAFTTQLTIGNSNAATSDSTWTGGFITNNISLVKTGTSNQTLGGNSSGRTTAGTEINGGSLILGSNTALYTTSASSTTTISNAGTQLRLSGSISTPSGAGLVLNQGSSIRSIFSTPTYGGLITLSGFAYFDADSGTTLNISSLNLNGQTAIVVGSGKVKWNFAPANGSTSAALVFNGTLDLTSVSATLYRAYGQGALSGSVNIASGGEVIGGNYEGGKTFSITGNVTTSGGIKLISGGVVGGIASRVSVGGTFNAGGTAMSVIGYGSGWLAGTEYIVGTYGSGTPSVSSNAGVWNDTTNTRVGNGTVRVDAVNRQILLTPGVVQNIATTWNGGESGLWYASQTTGWISGSSPTSFQNGDTITFNPTQNSTTATINGSIIAASLTFTKNSGVDSSQTITGSGTITNNGALTITNTTSAPHTVQLRTTGSHGAINISHSSAGVPALFINHPSAIGGSSAITYTWSGAGTGTDVLYFGAGANGLSTNRNINFASNTNSSINVAAGASVALSGVISHSGGSFTLLGGGNVTLAGNNTFTSPLTINNATASVASLTNGGVPGSLGAAALSSTNLIFNNGTLRHVGAATSTDRDFFLENSGTLDASGTGTLTLSGRPALSATRTLVLAGTTSGSLTSTFGNSSGTLSLRKEGSGTWTLSGSNTHSGTNILVSGRIIAAKKTALGTGNVQLTGSLQCTDTITDSAKIASVGSFTSNGGHLILGS